MAENNQDTINSIVQQVLGQLTPAITEKIEEAQNSQKTSIEKIKKKSWRVQQKPKHQILEEKVRGTIPYQRFSDRQSGGRSGRAR